MEGGGEGVREGGGGGRGQGREGGQREGERGRERETGKGREGERREGTGGRGGAEMDLMQTGDVPRDAYVTALSAPCLSPPPTRDFPRAFSRGRTLSSSIPPPSLSTVRFWGDMLEP